jgi:hypothetical protein
VFAFLFVSCRVVSCRAGRVCLFPRGWMDVDGCEQTPNAKRQAPAAHSLATAIFFRGGDARSLAAASGSFHTSDCRGGVEGRQLALKGAEGGD